MSKPGTAPGGGSRWRSNCSTTATHLPARIVYNWADIYSQQLLEGQDYKLLQPVFRSGCWPTTWWRAHDYQLRDRQGRVLAEHGGIWLFELGKFNVQDIHEESQRWLRFFKEGGQLDDEHLPGWMQTQEMRQAMNTLKRFSEKERDYHAYQARQNFIREQRTLALELEEERQEKPKEREEKLAAMQREAAALKREDAALQEYRAAQGFA